MKNYTTIFNLRTNKIQLTIWKQRSIIMKKFFKFIGSIFLLLIIAVATISCNKDLPKDLPNDLPYEKIENVISEKQYKNVNEMLRDGFTADRSTAQRVYVNTKVGKAQYKLDGYFVRIKVKGPSIEDNAIIYMDGNENNAAPVYCTDPTSQTAFVMNKNKMYYSMQGTKEWKALNLNK